MRFWSVLVWNSETEEGESFRVAGASSNTAKTIKDTFRQVHPEWKNIRMRRVKKPAWWTYGEK